MQNQGRDLIWLYWLERRSVFRTAPGLVYLLPYLLGVILWRLSQIQLVWYQREVAVLLHGVALAGVTLFWSRQYWWRGWVVLRERLELLVICLVLVLVGYLGAGYHWMMTDLEGLYEQAVLEGRKNRGEVVTRAGVTGSVGQGKYYLDVWVQGQLTKVDGSSAEGGKQKWLVRPMKVYLGQHQDELLPLPARGFLLKRYPQIQVTFSKKEILQIGDQVLLVGRLESFPPATNPGQFDYQRFQRYTGLLGEMRDPEVYPLQRPRWHFLRGLDRGKQRAYRYFQGYLSQGSLPLVISLLTGESDYLPEAELEKIRSLGLSHLLAISGLHLGLVVTVLQKLLKLIPGSDKYQPWLLMIGIWLAVIFVGGRPSALRVGIYLTLSQVGHLLKRPLHAMNLLAITGYLILLVNPLTLFLLSFQLSFVVYLSILLLREPIGHGVRRCLPDHWLIRPVGESLALSLAAFLGSAPVVLYHFYEIPLQGIVMNLWAVPLVGTILILTLITLLMGLVLPPIGMLLVVILDWLVGWFRWLVIYCSDLGDWSMQMGRPLFLWIGIFYGVCWLGWWLDQRKEMPILWVWRERGQLWRYLIVVLGVVGLTLIFPLEKGGLEWVLLDVGQGDGMFLTLPNDFVILIDGGGKPGKSSSNFTGEKIVKPFLSSRGISKIDLLCITHFDADHVQGLLTVLRDFKVERIWMPEGSSSSYLGQVLKLAQMKKIPIQYPKRGDLYQLGGVQLQVLHPEAQGVYEKENDRSLVFMLTYAGQKVLLTGDLGEEAEVALLADQELGDLRVDLLKVGHHGSKYSTSELFLERVDPRLALISVGENRYGHPSPELLERLIDKSCNILRTDQSGAIQVVINGQEIRVRKFQQK